MCIRDSIQLRQQGHVHSLLGGRQWAIEQIAIGQIYLRYGDVLVDLVEFGGLCVHTGVRARIVVLGRVAHQLVVLVADRLRGLGQDRDRGLTVVGQPYVDVAAIGQTLWGNARGARVCRARAPPDPAVVLAYALRDGDVRT